MYECVRVCVSVCACAFVSGACTLIAQEVTMHRMHSPSVSQTMLETSPRVKCTSELCPLTDPEIYISAFIFP